MVVLTDGVKFVSWAQPIAPLNFCYFLQYKSTTQPIVSLFFFAAFCNNRQSKHTIASGHGLEVCVPKPSFSSFLEHQLEAASILKIVCPRKTFQRPFLICPLLGAQPGLNPASSQPARRMQETHSAVFAGGRHDRHNLPLPYALELQQEALRVRNPKAGSRELDSHPSCETPEARPMKDHCQKMRPERKSLTMPLGCQDGAPRDDATAK